MLVYLDTNLVSSIARDDHKVETEAIATVLLLKEIGHIQLITSQVTGEEIDRCTGPHREEILTVFEKMRMVPYINKEVHLGYDSYWEDDFGAWSNPLYDVDKVWYELTQIGLDSTDAHHVMLALRGSCNVFLTLDSKTILKHREKVEVAFQIKLQKPSEFLAICNKIPIVKP